MQEKKIQLGSGELTYFQGGSGRPLLWLHPAGGVRRSKVLEGLAQSFALHVPVFPGWEGTALHAEVSSRQPFESLIVSESGDGDDAVRCGSMVRMGLVGS